MSLAVPLRHQSPKEFRDRLVRYVLAPSGVLTDDPSDWSYIDGNTFEVTFGGTATNGDYVITIDPVSFGIASIPITTTRAGGSPSTNADLAAQSVIETATLLAAGTYRDPTALATYIISSSSSAAVQRFYVRDDAPPFRVTLSPPAPATLAVVPDDQFPILFGATGHGPVIQGAKTALEVTLIPVDSNRVPLDPNGATVNLTIRRMIDRSPSNLNGGNPPAGVASASTVAATFGRPVLVDSASGYYGFGLDTITGTITGLEGIEVWVRETSR